jgi:acyl-CoA thioester hydrolase
VDSGIGTKTDRRWQHRLLIPVQFRDFDLMGHVNNAVYLSYCEQARTEFYVRASGKASVRDLDFVVARAEIDFKSSLRHDEAEVEVLVRTAKVGESSWTLEYLLRRPGTGDAVAEARTVQVYYDYATREKRPIPAALRERLLAFSSAPHGES